MSQAELIGLAAGVFIALSWGPQILRVVRLRSANEISVTFASLQLVGILLWFAYGLLLGLTSVIIWNGANFVLVSVLLVFKLRYGMGPHAHRRGENPSQASNSDAAS